MSRLNVIRPRCTVLADSAWSRLLLALPLAGGLWLAVAWAWGAGA